MCDEKYDSEWYNDSGYSRHITGRKEELREFRTLKDGGRVKFGNNTTIDMKGYGMITNEEFSIRKEAYVEGLQHNLVSVSQMVVGTGLKVYLDEDGSEIVENKSKSILLESKSNGKMYSLNSNPIKEKPSNFFLMKAFLNDSWLWH